MKSTERLLQQLAEQIKKLTTLCNNATLSVIDEQRFDEQLFPPLPHQMHKVKVSHYLQEIDKNFHYLSQVIADGQSEKVAYLSEKLVNQIVAINRELATQKLRIKEPEVKYDNPHHTYSRYLNYQRRLNNMRIECEQQLAQATSLSQQQSLQQQLATLEGRIFRCNKAIRQLEISLESDIVTR